LKKDAVEDTAIKESNLASTYDRLTTNREPYLERARSCALLTLPSVFPKEGVNGSTEFYQPFQSVGARGVNNLANKLLLSLLPPNTPFFKLSADDKTIAELADETARAKVEEKFNEIERSVQTRIETGGFRSPFITAIRQLLIGGNVLIVKRPKEKIRIIRLDNYVVRRAANGDVLEVISVEKTRYEDLTDDLKKLVDSADVPNAGSTLDSDKSLNIYTGYKLEGTKYKIHQSLGDKVIPGSEGSYAKDKAPFIALRWSFEDNEDYGRSYVEEYVGDLKSAEGLSEAVIEASAAASKVVFFVAPNGLTREDDVATAENLAVITGRAEDVSVLQVEKRADLQVTNNVLNDIIQRLSYAFLMHTAIQRDAERVTAEEIRGMIKELEDTLGGTYALLSQEFQYPFVKLIMAELVEEKAIPNLDALKKDGISIEPKITTGIEAIGRGHDLSKLQTFMTQFVVPFGEQGIAMINVPDFLKRCGVSLGIDMDGLVKSEDQLTQEREAAMQQQQEAMAQDTVSKSIQAAAGPAAANMTKAGNA